MVILTYLILIGGATFILGFPFGTGLGILVCALASGAHHVEGEIPFDDRVGNATYTKDDEGETYTWIATEVSKP